MVLRMTLAEYRKSLGLTIDQLSERWKMRRTTLHSWETGYRLPGLAAALRVKELSGGAVQPADFAPPQTPSP